MSTEEIEAQYADRLLDFHLTHSTPPSQFLTWENLTKCPSLLMDIRLDGLDWDTISGLFDCLDTIKTMHIDLNIATSQWMNESYDICNPDDTISHNLVLALLLTSNAQPRVEPMNNVIGNCVFSAVVMYKPTAQNMCSLQDAVSELCEFARKDTPAITLVSLSEATSYFPYRAEEDRIDYTIVPVDNGMTQVIGPSPAFLVGRLLHVIENDITNVILPPAFSLEAEAWDFDWVPHPI